MQRIHKLPTTPYVEILKQLDGTTLFYPCSDKDLKTPVSLFSPYIRDFWFVDKEYFLHNAASKEQPALHDSQTYELLDIEITGRETADSEQKGNPEVGKRRAEWVEPCVRTERYVHKDTGRIISIHRRRGYGLAGLQKEIKTGALGVFFYRGDSDDPDTKGSRQLWLTLQRGKITHKRHIYEVLDKLVNGGLIVTDGSNCAERENPYAELGRFRHKVNSLKLLRKGGR